MRARDLLRRPVILIALGMLATASLVLGARAVTSSLLDPGAASARPDTAGPSTEAGSTTTVTEVIEQTRSTDRTATTFPPTTSDSPVTSHPTGPDGPALLESLTAEGVTIGEPVVTPHQPGTFQDRVTALPAVVTGLPSLPTEAAPPDTASGSSDGVEDRPDVSSGEAAPLPRAFAVGVMVESESHFAVIRVGVDSGLEGLSDLVVDFGDGDVLDVPQARIDQIGDVGTLEIVHRYEPTLTPQPQEVTATATDGAGTVKMASARFETRAKFMVSYSPLTVTALDDCDLFGKGDFELKWNNDGRDRSSRFDLGKGESYVEEEFRVGVEAFYGEGVDFSISIAELDSVALRILRFVSGAYLDSGFIGPRGNPWIEVMQLGSHTVPITIERPNYEECDTRLELTVTLALFDRAPG